VIAVFDTTGSQKFQHDRRNRMRPQGHSIAVELPLMVE
jgi:hypothetical protein